MKKILLFLAAIVSLFTAVAQTQQGYVVTLGRSGKPGVNLSGVLVRAVGSHNNVVSNQQGMFSLSMYGKKQGDAYILQRVEKDGYELNDYSVIGRKYAYSSSVPLKIVMVSSKQLQEDIIAIENAMYKKAADNYHAKLDKLEAQKTNNEISAEKYSQEIQELNDGFEKYQSLIGGVAEYYAHLNYDELDEREKDIALLIETGKLEKADSLIRISFDETAVLQRNKSALEALNREIAGAEQLIAEINSE